MNITSFTAPPQRILVTGATGFVGTHLLRELGAHLSGKDRVIGGSRHGGPLPEGLESVSCDMTDLARIEEVVREIRPTNVVHLASTTTLREADDAPARTWQVNVMAPLRMGQALAKYCPGAQFIYVGSAEVYGGCFAAGAVNEDAPLAPLNTYAYTKAAADLLIGELSRAGIRVVRARPFNHIGPGQSERFVLSSFAAQIARIEKGRQESVLSVGNLESERDFLDVREVASAYHAMILQCDSLPRNLVLNIASGRARRIRSVLHDMLALATVPIEVRPDPARMRPSETPLILGDASRAQQILDWQPRIAWEQTLTDILDDWRKRVTTSQQDGE